MKIFANNNNETVMMFHYYGEIKNIWYKDTHRYMEYDEKEIEEMGYWHLKNLQDIPTLKLINTTKILYYPRLYDKYDDIEIRDYYNEYIEHLLDWNVETEKGVTYIPKSDDDFENCVDYLLLGHGLEINEYNKKIIEVKVLNRYNKEVRLDLRAIEVNI